MVRKIALIVMDAKGFWVYTFERACAAVRKMTHYPLSSTLNFMNTLKLLSAVWLLSVLHAFAEDPDLGPNVLIFGPNDDAKTIQSKCDDIFRQQERAQFGQQRNAILFKPGRYPVTVNVGFYTQVYGLGQFPDDVTLTGGFHCDAKWNNGNGTINFWRGIENFTAGDAPDKNIMWAASQATPMRRMHVKGKFWLFQWDGRTNWTSGGFMADTLVEGQVIAGSQQQWLSRNSEWKSWSNGVWNMVFVGCQGVPSGTWPGQPYTTIEKTPVIREKPFLYIDSDGNYKVFVPGERRDSSNYSWMNNQFVGNSIPLTDFYIAKSDKDTSATINEALGKGQNLLLTPGIYKLDEAIRVTRPGTVVLGLGMATLNPQKGNSALEVADVSGVRIANMILDAGSVNSPCLMQIGEPGSKASHADDPTIIYDIFARIGGGEELGVATCAVIINSNDVIGDHAWLWRADHGNQVGWNTNKSDNGLIVNGNNVTFYGLFAEHFQKECTLWNGDNGRTYFYQCELPYDPPTQSEYRHDAVNGWPGYKVSENVKTHEAWGLGVYCFYNNDDIVCDNAYEVPKTSDVKIHHACTLGFKEKSGISNVVNGVGSSTMNSKGKAQRVLEYPE